MASCEIRGAFKPGFDTVLTPEALEFVAMLAERFGPTVQELLAARESTQAAIDGGQLPDFLSGTREIRELDWMIAELPDDLQDRRIEILAQAQPARLIAALNSGASVCVADFEDSLAPTWNNVIVGQRCLYEAVRGELSHERADGTRQTLGADTATLAIRPRGWHLPERHLYVNGEPVAGSLVDFGLYFFHNAEELLRRGSGPYFSLPKLENHREAHLWTSVFEFAENQLGVPQYSIKATAFIETLLAAFEIDEILYVLKDYLVALECGPSDYLFSFIKTLRAHPEFVLPERRSIELTQRFLHTYGQLAVKSAHHRGVLAIGGTAAQIPVAEDEEANAAQLAAVRREKSHEIDGGYDGTWVAHPDIVPVVRSLFEDAVDGPNQLGRLRRDLTVTATDLLTVPEGQISAQGLRDNVRLCVLYLGAWLGGEGCVEYEHSLEDMAAVEAARAQLWQWVHHGAKLDDGSVVTMDIVAGFIREELDLLRATVGEAGFTARCYARAGELLESVTAAAILPDFLTLAAYEDIV